MPFAIISQDRVTDGWDLRVSFDNKRIFMFHFQSQPTEAELEDFLVHQESMAINSAAEAVNMNEEVL